MTQRPLARSALIVGLGNVGSRVLGLVREQVIAALFGASAATDAFRVAFRVPLAVYDLLVGGMVSSALVPVLAAAGRAGDPAAARRTGSLLTLFLLAMLVAMAALMAGATALVAVLAAGYPPEVRALSADLLRVLAPALVFMGASGVLTAVLNAQERFRLPALATVAFNGGMVLGALALHSVAGIGGLAVGVLLGAGLQVAIQVPGLRGLAVRPGIHLGDPALRQVLRLYAPVALGLLVSTAGVAIDTHLASRTGEGSLAAMGFATTLVQFPLGLIAAGVGAAVLPALSRHAAAAAGPAFRATLTEGLRLVLVLILPATVGLALLREPLIALLFQRGAFDGTAAARTATAFLAYAPGLPAAAIDQVLIFGFYARQRTLAPVLVGVAAVGVYLVVGLALLGPLGMPGLALANSAQWVAHMVIMALLTRRTPAPPLWAGLRATLSRCTIGVAVMGLVVVAARPGPWDPARGSLEALVALAPALALGAAGYTLVLAVIGRQELELLLGALRRRPSE